MKRLLLVDDDVDVLDALEMVLGETFEVVTAADGAEALRRLERERFDVVLLDLMMPRIDGEAVVRCARAARIEVPILLGSAFMDLEEVSARLSLPALKKPYRIPELTAALAELANDGAMNA